MIHVVHYTVAKAGMADTLVGLYKKRMDFLVDGYDMLGEN
jgi:hypothetical protein